MARLQDARPAECSLRGLIVAVNKLCSLHKLTPDKLFLWIDYVSIPQENGFIQKLAISSLGFYASICEHFVVLAPSTMHQDTMMMCNASAYARRGWCRLEQWARIAGVKGEVPIYILGAARSKAWRLSIFRMNGAAGSDPCIRGRFHRRPRTRRRSSPPSSAYGRWRCSTAIVAIVLSNCTPSSRRCMTASSHRSSSVRCRNT